MRSLFKLFLSPSVFTTESMGIRKIHGGVRGRARHVLGEGKAQLGRKLFCLRAKGKSYSMPLMRCQIISRRYFARQNRSNLYMYRRLDKFSKPYDWLLQQRLGGYAYCLMRTYDFLATLSPLFLPLNFT